MVPETRVFQAADSKDLVIHPCDRWTDRQTDRWTNRIVMAKTHYSSSCCCT